MGRRDFVKTRSQSFSIDKTSLFYNYYDDPIDKNYDNDTTDDKAKYVYRIVPCMSGVDVLEKYKSDKYKPKPNELIIFVEKKDDKKSNLFGTACLVKMGEKRKNIFFPKLLHKDLKVSVNDDSKTVNNLMKWAERIAYYSKNKNTEISAIVLSDAIKLELNDKKVIPEFLEKFFNLNNNIADWMRKGVKEMDKWKFTEENYDYAKYGNKLKPIIPINILNTYGYSKTGIVDLGLNKLKVLADDFNKIVYINPYLATLEVPISATLNFNLLLPGTIWLLKIKLDNIFPDSIKKIFASIKEIFYKAEYFINDIGKFIKTEAALLNAFLCGLINGLISFLQMIVGLVAFVIDNNPLMELENITVLKKAEFQQKLEFIEDLIDSIHLSINEIFSGIISNIKNITKDFSKFVVEIKNKLANFSKYFWAYAIGAVAFELISDAIIAFFTGGVSMVEEGISIAKKAFEKISRISTELAEKGLNVAKKTIKKAVSGTKALLEFIKKEIAEFIEALKNGTLLQWLKEKLYKLLGIAEEEAQKYANKVNKLIDDIENGIVKLDEKVDKNGNIVKRHARDFTRYGNLGEMVSDAKWLNITRWGEKEVKFKALHKMIENLDTPIKKGIDAIYENLLFESPPMPPPPKYIINEVKYKKSTATISKGVWRNMISKKITKSGASQMMEEWIEHNLKEMINDPIKQLDILKNYKSYLTGISKNGKKVEIFELSKDVKKVSKINL